MREPSAKFFGMAFSRRIVARLVVAVLAISLSSQLLEGQAMRCMDMNRAMSSAHMQHSHDAASVSSSDKQSERAPQSSSSCLLNTLCLNAPAILVSAPVSFEAPLVAVVIDFGAAAPAAQSHRPDSPPPKI
jgi:hypothetical protein